MSKLPFFKDAFSINGIVSEEPKGEFINTPNELGYVVHNGVRHDKNDGCPWCSKEPKQKACKHDIVACAGCGERYCLTSHKHLADCHPAPSLNTWEESLKNIVARSRSESAVYQYEQLQRLIASQITLAIQNERDNHVASVNTMVDEVKMLRFAHKRAGAQQDSFSHGLYSGYLTGIDDALTIISNKGVEEKGE